MFDAGGDLRPVVNLYEGDGSSTFGLQATTALEDGEWGHTCVTWDGATGAIYVNGALSNRASGQTQINQSDGPFLIGNCDEGACGSMHFGGDIDEAVLLRRALSPLEVRLLYESRAEWGAVLTSAAWPQSLDPAKPSTAQPDFDDLLVTEDGAGVEFEVVGARPLADRAADLDGHVIGYWPLDGPDLGNVVGGGTLQATGQVPSVGGRFGDAAGAVDGSAGYLTDQGPEPVFSMNDITLEAWVFRTAEGSGSGDVLCHWAGSTGHRGYLLDLYEGLPRCTFSGGDVRALQASTTLPLGRWVHLACTWDSATATNRVWVDGLEDTNVHHQGGEIGANVRPPAGTQQVLIGGRANTLDDPDFRFPGYIDEVALHDVVRSPDYLYKHAHPLPRVRFLAHTAAQADGDGRWPYRSYVLRWGDSDALQSDSVPADGLLSPRNGYHAWWRFDEVAGSTVIDSATGRHHGTLVSPATLGAPAGGGAALRMDGSGGVTVEGLPSFAAAAGFTVETSFLQEGAGGGAQVLLNRGDQGGGPVQLNLELDGNRVFGGVAEDWAAGPLATRISAADAVEAAAWTHASATHDGLFLRLYVGGELAAVGQREWTPFRGLEAIMTIGHRIHGSPLPLDGWLDEVRIMNRVFAPEELLVGPPTRWTLGPLVGQPSCPDDMVRITALGNVCIDAYEASEGEGGAAQSGAGEIPWASVLPDAAAAACQAAGKRLCAAEEWIAACQGPDGHVYPYVDAYDAHRCNGERHEVWGTVRTGNMQDCEGGYPGLFDMSGNIAEWTASACTGDECVVRGGCWGCGQGADADRCDSVNAFPVGETNAGRGFRCCLSLP